MSQLALLANTIATGAVLIALILTFGPISGAHFNPVVSVANSLEGGMAWSETFTYVLAQIVGGIGGTILAHVMFSLPVVSLSRHIRSGPAQFVSECTAAFGFLCVIWGCSRVNSRMVPFAVGSYITAAYWVTASTSFANPAVTIARALSDTFSGIRPIDVPLFVVAQFSAGLAATLLFRWLAPSLPSVAKDVLIPHRNNF